MKKVKKSFLKTPRMSFHFLKLCKNDNSHCPRVPEAALKEGKIPQRTFSNSRMRVIDPRIQHFIVFSHIPARFFSFLAFLKC